MTVTPATDVVTREVRDGVAVLTLNRPDRLNAWIPAMQVRYFDLLEEAAADPEVKAIVVTGAGRGFCAGADMEALQAIGSDEGSADDARGDDRPQTFPMTIPKPVIAAVNGPAAGLGLVMALMCDIRFAAAGAKLTTAFARRGLIAEQGSRGCCRGWSAARTRWTCCSRGGCCSPRRRRAWASSTPCTRPRS